MEGNGVGQTDVDRTGCSDRNGVGCAGGLKVVMIGSGNVATHLAAGLSGQAEVVQVYSRDISHARRLASLSGGCCVATDDAGSLRRDADLYVISVSDDALREVVGMMPHVGGVVAHTSGSVPMDVLSAVSGRYGVLYPLQTFSREADVDLGRVPFFTEAVDADTLRFLDAVAGRISGNVRHAGSASRAVIHIAAVMACNFPNYLWGCAAEILAEAGYGLDVLRPLIETTLDKAMSMPPHDAQTGPARRGDTDVMCYHLDTLPPEMRGIYRMLSRSIMDHHKIKKIL